VFIYSINDTKKDTKKGQFKPAGLGKLFAKRPIDNDNGQ
jgi:hypothetical protein